MLLLSILLIAFGLVFPPLLYVGIPLLIVWFVVWCLGDVGKGISSAIKRAGKQKCPFCQGEIPQNVKKCQYCGEWLEITEPLDDANFVEDKHKWEIRSSDLITELSGGVNLVDGKHTWEYAKEEKHNLELMKRSCDAEIKASKNSKLVPPPYCFKRVAILLRKAKNFEQEIFYCNMYLKALAELKEAVPDIPVPLDAYAGWFIERIRKTETLLKKSQTKI